MNAVTNTDKVSAALNFFPSTIAVCSLSISLPLAHNSQCLHVQTMTRKRCHEGTCKLTTITIGRHADTNNDDDDNAVDRFDAVTLLFLFGSFPSSCVAAACLPPFCACHCACARVCVLAGASRTTHVCMALA